MIIMLRFLDSSLGRISIIAVILVFFGYTIRELLWYVVKNKSIYYKDMSTLKKNSKYYKINPVYYHYIRLDSKRKFDNYDLKVGFRDLINRKTEYLKNIKLKADFNKKFMGQYYTDVEEIKMKRSSDGLPKTLIPNFIFIYIEDKIIKRVTIKDIVLYPYIRVYKKYTSPAGRNNYERYYDYSFSEVAREYQQMLIDYENVQKAKRTVEYQRGLMTPSLRYDILKRDKFACQICGYTQKEGVKLHVDHIIPVSKGGRTKKNNLRTLCSNCNLGKSDKYDPVGVN